MKVFHTLKPIYNANSKILILGSMSSIVSRNAGFYYVHKTNRFWRILEIVFNVSLNTVDEKTNFLLKNNIALWDTIFSCDNMTRTLIELITLLQQTYQMGNIKDAEYERYKAIFSVYLSMSKMCGEPTYIKIDSRRIPIDEFYNHIESLNQSPDIIKLK